MSTTLPDFLTIDQVARMLGINASGVRRYCRLGRLRAERAGPIWLIPRRDLEEFRQHPRPVGNPNFRRDN